MREKSEKTIVVGGDHHNTLGVIRALGYESVQSILILLSDKCRNYVDKSRYVITTYYISDESKLTKTLLQVNKDYPEANVVICCSDGASSEIDLNYDLLKDIFRFPNSGYGQGYLTSIMDKDKMLSVAEECGIKIPKIWHSVEDIKFPCICKPLVSKLGAKSDITICRTTDDLNEFCKNKHISDKFQFQEFIDKEIEYQLIGCSLNSGDNVIIPGVSTIIRSSAISNTGLLSYGPLSTLNVKCIDECVEFLKKIKFSGLFSMEFIRDKSGKDYFMEINLRNDGNAICVTAAGVNLPYIWYNYNAHNVLPGELRDVNIIQTMPEFDDFSMVLHRKVSLWSWIRDVRKSQCFMEFDKRDMTPFFYRVYQLLRLKI